MAKVGCEVIAVYNALRAIGRQPTLAEIIRSFGKNGWVMLYGSCGSDPFAIDDYFDLCGVRYDQYKAQSSYRDFKAALEKNDSDVWAYIVSFYTADANEAEFNMHTVMLRLDSSGTTYCYNRNNNSTGCETYSDLDELNENDSLMFDRFIVGYAVYRDNRR